MILLLSLYALLVFFGIYHHEPWRDEAHIWISAREDSFVTVFTDIRDTGTPVLWTLLNVPLARLGFPFESMSVLHALLAITSAGLLLFYSRLPVLIKTLYIFSYYTAYEYAVVARNYVLTGLLLFTLASIYPNRFRRAGWYAFFTALLFHTNSLSFGFAFAVMILFTFEIIAGRKFTFGNIFSVLLMFGSALFYIFSVIPEGSVAEEFTNTSGIIPQILHILRNAIVPSFSNMRDLVLPSDDMTRLVILLSAILHVFFFMSLATRPKLLLLWLTGSGWFFYVNTIIHRGSLRHLGLWLFFLIFLYWIYSADNQRRHMLVRYSAPVIHITLGILLFLSTWYTVYIYREDFLYPFSGSKITAKTIQEKGLGNDLVIAYKGGRTEPVMAYLPNARVWYAETDSEGYHNLTTLSYYYSYIKDKQEKSQEDVLRKVITGIGDISHILVLSDPLTGSLVNEYVLVIYENARYFWSNETEDIYVYKPLQ